MITNDVIRSVSLIYRRAKEPSETIVYRSFHIRSGAFSICLCQINMTPLLTTKPSNMRAEERIALIAPGTAARSHSFSNRRAVVHTFAAENTPCPRFVDWIIPKPIE